jgi:hypothetical protein
MIDDNKDICTACQLEYGDPESHCYKQNGRECYLDKQEQEVEERDNEE